MVGLMSFYDPGESFAYCAGNCQASRYPVETCRCPCRGRNHGVLRHRASYVDVQAYPAREEYPSERVIFSLPAERLQLTAQSLGHELDKGVSLAPALRDGESQISRDNLGFAPSHYRVSDMPTSFRPEIRRTSRGRAITHRVARSLKHSLIGVSETERNESILRGLRSQFSQDNVDIAIDQAFSVFYSHNPDLPRPELYELFETGLIDKALELMGKRWVIGRPKK